MGIVTILRFLIGQRQAILDIAASRHAIWLGLLFVFSAGFAREYDGEDLLHEPWHLLIPLAASLATSTLLYVLLWVVFRGWATIPNEWQTFRAFVSLYWMTAQLAWLYAIPVERFLPAAESVNANYWLLAIVATWRVVLIVRVASVLFRAPAGQAVFPVLLFSHTVLVALTSIIPAPILSIMGGVRLSDSDRIIADVTFLILATAGLVWPILAVATVISIFAVRPRERAPSLSTLPMQPVQRSAWLLAAAALAIWIFILPLTQPEQQRRRQAEQLLCGGRIGDGLDFMVRHGQSSFPPHWDPPPRIGYPDEVPTVMEAFEEVSLRPQLPSWIAQAYVRKFESQLGHFHPPQHLWNKLPDQTFDRYLDVLEKHPFSEEIKAWQHAKAHLGNRSPEQNERFRRVMQPSRSASEAAVTSDS